MDRQQADRKPRRKWPWVVLILLLAVSGGLYVRGLQKLEGVFLPNTTLDGEDVSLQSPEKIDRMTRERGTDRVLTFREMGGRSETISYRSVGYEHTRTPSAAYLAAGQNHWLWPVSLWRKTAFTSEKGFTYDKERLKKRVHALQAISGTGIVDPEDAAIVKGKDRYELIEATDGNRLDEKKVLECAEKAIESGETSISLGEKDCYLKPARRSDDAHLQSAFERIDAVQNETVTLELYGSSVPVDKSVFFDWLQFDEDTAEVSLDQDALTAYVNSLAGRLDTFGKARQFRTSAGDTVAAGGGGHDNYGFTLQKEDTKRVLEDAILGGESVKAEAVWERTGRTITPEGDDIGRTYIEISIDRQHMWYYRDGTLAAETDVTTGKMADNRETPTGVFYVMNKMSHYTMRGSYGSSFVNFALLIDSENGIYIHDAPWRTRYGGQIYVTDGSHGCINTPYDAEKQLFETVDTGTPVVIYDRNHPS